VEGYLLEFLMVHPNVYPIAGGPAHRAGSRSDKKLF